MKNCVACQRPVPDEAKFCGFCGFRLTPMTAAGKANPILLTQPKRPVLAAEKPAAAQPEIPANRSGQPKREAQRFPLKVEVTYASEHNFFTGFVQNISSGGLFVATHKLTDVGQELRVSFSIPGFSKPYDADCEVTWVKEYDAGMPDMIPGMGLRFLDLDPHVADAIDRFIRHREPIFFEPE